MIHLLVFDENGHERGPADLPKGRHRVGRVLLSLIFEIRIVEKNRFESEVVWFVGSADGGARERTSGGGTSACEWVLIA